MMSRSSLRAVWRSIARLLRVVAGPGLSRLALGGTLGLGLGVKRVERRSTRLQHGGMVALSGLQLEQLPQPLDVVLGCELRDFRKPLLSGCEPLLEPGQRQAEPGINPQREDEVRIVGHELLALEVDVRRQRLQVD